MDHDDLTLALKSAKAAASDACAILRECLNSPLTVSTKSNFRDLVTNADVAAEQAIRARVEKEFPHVGWMGEESGGEIPEQGLFWVVDPLDGTTNFSHRYPWFCTSIALAQAAHNAAGFESLVGVVAHPLTGALYHAMKGKGAYLGDRRLAIRGPHELREALLMSGFAYDTGPLLQKTIATLQRILPHVQGMRRSGSAALDLCGVADGSLDAFWEYGPKPWDVAAGMLFIQEAGGITHYLPKDGKQRNLIFAAAPGIAHKLLRLLSEDDPRLEPLLALDTGHPAVTH